MLDVKKTFVLAIIMLVGTFAGFFMGKIDGETFKWVLTSVSGMIGLREIGDKLLKKGQ